MQEQTPSQQQPPQLQPLQPQPIIAPTNIMPAGSMPPLLVGDDVSLDFLNSICAPKGQWIDWLIDGQGLLNWMCDAGLIDQNDKNWFGERYDRDVLNDVAIKARQLREDFRHVIYDLTHHDQSPPKMDFINHILAQDCSHDAMKWDDNAQKFMMTGQYNWQQPDDLLLPIAKSMAHLICSADFSGNSGRIKNCDNPPCSLWFLDVSKNGRRRWCSMAVCGNRHKAALYRQKQV